MDTDGLPTRSELRGIFTPELQIDDPDEDLAPLLAATNELIHRSLATGTYENYASAWLAWLSFCEQRGLCPLPAEPRSVALYLAAVGSQVDDGGVVVTDDGEPLPGRLRPNTAARHLSTINKAHKAQGYPRPGDDEIVAAVLRGLRRTFGSAPQLAKAALDMPLLERLLAANDEPLLSNRRDLAIVFLSMRLRLTPGQLAGLPWTEVALDLGDGLITAPSPTRSTRKVEIPLTPCAPGRTGPFEALRALRLVSPEATYVLEHPGTHQPLSRQGIHQAIRRLAGDALHDDLHLWRVVHELEQPTLRQLRNRALILVGWYAALRRSNLTWARWDDFRVEQGDWELTLRRSKTNPDGAKRQVNWLTRSEGDWPCPVAAIEAWRDALAEALGCKAQELGPHPVFVQLHKSGSLKLDGDRCPRALSGHAICELIQDLAQRAGLDASDFGGHSLRAGFVTEALTDDKVSVSQVQDTTHHVDLNTLADYRRIVNGRKHNAARQLYQQEKPGSAPTPGGGSPDDLRRQRRTRGA
jgi:integrase